MEVGGHHHAPAALPSGKISILCIGGRVGPRSSLDGCRKSCSQPGFNSHTIIQPIASHYTNYAILALYAEKT